MTTSATWADKHPRKTLDTASRYTNDIDDLVFDDAERHDYAADFESECDREPQN